MTTTNPRAQIPAHAQRPMWISWREVRPVLIPVANHGGENYENSANDHEHRCERERLGLEEAGSNDAQTGADDPIEK